MARFVISAVAAQLEKQFPQPAEAEVTPVADDSVPEVQPAPLRTATICAEYRGPRVVKGTELTLLKGDSPHPAFRPNQTLSLDVIGGKEFSPTFIIAALSLEGEKPDAPEGFWSLVALADKKGIDAVIRSKAPEENIRRYLAFHAWVEYWLEEHVMEHEATHDMTDDVWFAREVLEKIVADDPLWIQFADKYLPEQAAAMA